MRRVRPLVLQRLLRLAALFLAATAVTASAADDLSRFTRGLSAAERAEIALDRLSSDEAAVLDALVRRDSAGRLSTANRRPTESNDTSKTEVLSPPTPPAVPFSQRLTPDERRLAGFSKLTAEHIARLDALVERQTNVAIARTLLGPPTFVPRRAQVQPAENEDRRKIHGSFSLSYGWGKGGYSERTGSMMMTYDDPAGRYSVTLGYTESHVKGGQGVYLDGPPYRYDDPLYRGP